jgi:hypothetical protein
MLYNINLFHLVINSTLIQFKYHYELFFVNMKILKYDIAIISQLLFINHRI